MEWVVYFGLGSMCYVIHKVLVSYIDQNRESNIKKGWRVLLGWVIVLSIFGAYYYHLEHEKLKDGKLYYVNLFETRGDQKNYRVPGLIIVDEGYELKTIYWSGGGKLNFDSGSTHLIEGEKVVINDEDGKGWYVELTNVRAEIP